MHQQGAGYENEAGEGGRALPPGEAGDPGGSSSLAPSESLPARSPPCHFIIKKSKLPFLLFPCLGLITQMENYGTPY